MEELEFLVNMTIMLVSAGICSVIFNKLKMPPIIGYLLAGILIVNVLEGPFKITLNGEIIDNLSHLGLVMLMFGIGMELDIDKLKNDGKFAMIVAIIQLPLMMMIGYVSGSFLGLTPSASIALGAIISGSSTAVVAEVLKMQKRISKETAETLILVTIMEDIGQVIILSMVTPIFAGGTMGMSEMTTLILKIIVFMIVIIAIGVKFMPRILDWIGDNTSQEVLLIVSVGLCFGLAYLSHMVGLSMAVGAFLMGVTLSRSKFKMNLFDKVEPMKELFMSIFFISIGMKVVFGEFIDNFGLAVAIVVIFMLGKFVTVFIGYFVGNKNYVDCFSCSISLMAMGEFAFIIAGEALKTNVITSGFYSAVIGASLLSMIILPLISRYTFRVVDAVEEKKPKLLCSVGNWAFNTRDRVYGLLQSAGIGNRIRNNIYTVYGSIVSIIFIEIIFTSFMDFLLEQIVSFFGCDRSIGFMLLMLMNLLALFSPTLFLVRSVKGINKALIEASEKNGTEMDRIYCGILQFGTITFVFVIDLLIMIVSPGPFGYVYLISIAPVIIALLLVYFLYARYKYKKGEDILDEENRRK